MVYRFILLWITFGILLPPITPSHSHTYFLFILSLLLVLPSSLPLSLSLLSIAEREHNLCLRAELDSHTEIPAHHLLLNLLGVCVSGSTGESLK